jgi:hypothetical protein
MVTYEGLPVQYQAQGSRWFGSRINPRLYWKQHIAWRLSMGCCRFYTTSRVLVAMIVSPENSLEYGNGKRYLWSGAHVGRTDIVAERI